MPGSPVRWSLVLAALLIASPLAAEPPAGAKPTEAVPKWREGLDETINAAMKEWQVPGLAIAVVKDGKVVLSQGYGRRDIEKNLPVTPRTLFAIGSITKSFCVAGLGMLVDGRTLDWDRPVRDYLPAFRLHDRVPTDRVTTRDLITHRTGLPRHDALWYLTKLNRRETFERLRFLEPTRDLRGRWQYNNLMFVTAGVLLEKVTGSSWEDFTRRRLFAPLGMTRSNFSVLVSQKADDFALPYSEEDGKVRRIPFRDITPVAPAGAINSSVEEMSRYLLFHLALGKHEGKQLLSRAVCEEMQAPQMVMPLALQKQNPFATPGDASYGLGLFVTRHRKEKMVQHGGAIDGFIAYLAFLPEHQIGVVVLTNLQRRTGNPVPIVVTHEVFDRLLGKSGIDWRERGRQQTKNNARFRAERKSRIAKDRKPGTTPTHALADLAGTYQHPAYGKLRVEAAGKELRLSFSGDAVLAKHYHYNTFEIVDSLDHPAAMLEDHKLTFLPGKEGVIDRVQIEMEPGVAEFLFRRVEKQPGR